jgi:hypothetical protein
MRLFTDNGFGLVGAPLGDHLFKVLEAVPTPARG